MHAGSPLQKNAPIFWKCFHCDIILIKRKSFTCKCIYIYIININSLIMTPSYCFVLLNKQYKTIRRSPCTMCMHAGSPLQKNAPIFGNVFTVTYLGVQLQKMYYMLQPYIYLQLVALCTHVMKCNTYVM